MCKAVEEFAERRAAEGEARGKREGKRENMLATAMRMLNDFAEMASSLKTTAAELQRNPSLLIRERVPAPLPETE